MVVFSFQQQLIDSLIVELRVLRCSFNIDHTDIWEKHFKVTSHLFLRSFGRDFLFFYDQKN